MTLVSSTTANKRLQGKVVIITGGARGIGASAVKLFHQNGAKVIIADIQDAEGQALADSLGGGDDISYIHCDVSSEDDVSSVVDAAVEKHGRLDVMYNNAGVADRPFGSILEATRADLDRVIGVNLVGAFLGAKHAVRVMAPKRSGCILFTTSACTATAGLGTHVYAASKHAILGLANNLSGEVGQLGIRVNCVSPFAIPTHMLTDFTGQSGDEAVAQAEQQISAMGNLKGQVLKVDDVAKAALFLASDDAQYVSGLNMLVDGGFSGVNPTMMRAFNLIQ